ncbi:alpha/beta fold hydrolase [Streptomyces sp. NPDC048172]|uniref:alpha/beta fold hydrolase n=1 Tax=Streptomyces sp. NPDC048172 TaxID=3365505 RepID=UPI003718D844
MRKPLHVTTWDDGAAHGAPAVFVHGILTWATDERYGFGAQRELARERRLLMTDRRGYGQSPDTGRSDFEEDAEDLVKVLESAGGPAGSPAHLVGHANGGLAALIAAGRRPDLVRSLALIQPSVFRVAADRAPVRALYERVAESSGPPPGLSPEEFLRASTEGIGMEPPEPTPARLRAARTSMGERGVWEADPALAPVRDAPWPVLVISGDWTGAPPLYREYAGEALMAAAEALTDALAARHLRVPGYYPHTQQPALVNAGLRELWAKTG